MYKLLAVLGVLLLIQLVLVVGVNLAGKDEEGYRTDEPLLNFDPKTVDGLRFEDGKHTLLLQLQDGRWSLPKQQGIAADQAAVKHLLQQLGELHKGWPVATTAEAARHFKLADDDFEGRISLLGQGRVLAQLYVGSSPGYRKVYVRAAGEDEVYAVPFNAWEESAKADDWIDKSILQLDAARVERLEMPGFVLQRQGEGFKLADADPSQRTDEKAAQSLVSKLANLRVQGLAAEALQATDKPVLVLKLTRKSGAPLTYRFYTTSAGGAYRLQRSDLTPYLFLVPEFTVQALRQARRDKLITAATPLAPAGPQPDKAQSPDQLQKAPPVQLQTKPQEPVPPASQTREPVSQQM